MSAFVPVNESVFAARRWGSFKALRWLPWAGAGLAVGLLAAGISGRLFAPPTAPPLVALRSAAGSTPALLAVRSTRAERQHDFVTVLGEAASVSPRSLTNIEAVVEFFDAGGRLRKVETALLELPSLRPGEESPFVVETRDEPGLSSYRVRFRHLLGSSIPSCE
jgi:hypothetical protein